MKLCNLGLLCAVLISSITAATSVLAQAPLPRPLPTATPLYPLGQAFSSCVTDPGKVLPGNVSFIWSTGGGGNGCPASLNPVPGVNSGYYWPLAWNDSAVNPSGTLAWFEANHPDWIAYHCDGVTPGWQGSNALSVSAVHGSAVFTAPKADLPNIKIGEIVSGAGISGTTHVLAVDFKSIPNTITVATPYAGSTGKVTLYFGADLLSVPLDIQNPDVQAFVLQFLDEAAAAGYQGIDLDVGGINNAGGQCGHYVGAKPKGGPAPAYGGTWVRQYAGGSTATVPDVAYAKAATAWACAITQHMHGLNPPLYTLGNVTSLGNPNLINASYNYPQLLKQMMGCYDIFATEALFLSCKRLPVPCRYVTDDQFAAVFEIVRDQAKIEPYWWVNYLPCSVRATCYGIATIRPSGGTGYAVGDQVTLENGAVLQIDAVASGRPTTASPLTGATKPIARPLTQILSTGRGSGATFSLTYAAAESYATALFLLLRPPLGDIPEYYSPVGWPMDHTKYVPLSPTWTPDLGTPTEDAYLDADGCWTRHFTHGLVVLHASKEGHCSVVVPPGAVNQFGTAVSAGVYALGPLGASVMTTP